MEVVRDIAGLRQRLRTASGLTVGLVPTMGNLHDGHLALVRACREATDVCLVSIFVNPTQFGAGEDYASYPRTLEGDLERLEDCSTDVVFQPSVAEMYPDGEDGHTVVSVPALADTLCGASRRGHFNGVATVVLKLFNIVAPHKAFFGEKDWQQLAVVSAMVRELNLPVEVIGVPTVRAKSGLALSSRNGYLSAAEREQAALLHRTLAGMKAAIEAGDHDYVAAQHRAHQALATGGFDVDYVAVRDAGRLTRPDADTVRLRILAAARLGRTRLIDNVGVDI